MAALAALAAPSLVAAHGFVSGVVSDGTWYSGTSPDWTYKSVKPATAGWYAKNQDRGFVKPSAYADTDIICHKDATPGRASIPVTAGRTIDLQWNRWVKSHHGPVITYLANCHGDCTSVAKANLKFFKIAAGGLNDGRTWPGRWASDDLMANNLTSTVSIPADIADGSYVLRHEIIALHAAGRENGAQNYPQCINIDITGGGRATPAGTPGTALYRSHDAGILIDIYRTLTHYDIPGPALYRSSESYPPVTRTARPFHA